MPGTFPRECLPVRRAESQLNDELRMENAECLIGLPLASEPFFHRILNSSFTILDS
jgi:hypothetical protein